MASDIPGISDNIWGHGGPHSTEIGNRQISHETRKDSGCYVCMGVCGENYDLVDLNFCRIFGVSAAIESFFHGAAV
jgi:hypothetical protein